MLHCDEVITSIVIAIIIIIIIIIVYLHTIDQRAGYSNTSIMCWTVIQHKIALLPISLNSLH